MNKAAILPFPGDPFLLNYWLGFFDRVWGKEVDTLYIHLNSTIEKPVVDYISEMCAKRPNIVLKITPHQIEHGDAINLILNEVKEDYIMLIEDDGFIFRPFMVEKCFRFIEYGQYDIVGSKRLSCSMEIADKAAKKWGLSYTGFGDVGCNFWPCFFFARKDLLLRTDRKFGARAWHKGELIEPLGVTLENEDVAAMDTFGNTSLQLRNLVPENKIYYVKQYHCHPDDIKHFEQRKEIFDGFASWCHIGSLSSGVGGVLMDDNGRALAKRLIDPPRGVSVIPAVCNSEMEQMEWERRVQMWLTFYENREIGKIEEFAELYRLAVYRIIDQLNLNIKRIKQRQEIYKTLGL